MALRRDYSLTKDIDFDKSRDIYTLSNEYESVNVPGRNSKRVMKYLLKIYKGFSGNGKEIGRIYDVYNSYSSMRVTDFDYMYVSEAALLKDMYVLLGDYDSELESLNDRLGRMIDTWLAAINPKVMNPEQKQKDVQYAAQVELMLNRRIFIYETQDFIEHLTKGCLDETDYPAEDPDPDSPYVSLEVPIMTHVPEEADISVDDLFSSELSQVLYNIVSQDSYVIMKMFHDYENGNVCVRLWKKENDGYVPQFFSVNKTNVYLEKIGFLDQRAIWPGLIEAAVKQLDCDGDKLFLAEAILGPEYVKYKPEYLLGPNEAPVEENFEEFNNLVDTYIKCTYDVYSAMLLTNSLVIPDEVAYVKLIFGIKEFIYTLTTCFNLSFDLTAGAVNLLKQLISAYQEDVKAKDRLSDPTVKKRLSICDTLKDLLRLLESDDAYHNNPRGYFAISLAGQIAEVLLKSLKIAPSEESRKEKTRAVMADKAFRKQIAKLNIHTLKHSSVRMAESVLAAMEER